ncbi:MAG: hypothetical protein Q9180_003761 [Flavoplaca navasiana]
MPPPPAFPKDPASMTSPADVPQDLPSPPTPRQEPTTITATPKQTKQNLPVFTPTSSIVFGKPSTPRQTGEQSLAPQSTLGNPSEGESHLGDGLDHPVTAQGKPGNTSDGQAPLHSPDCRGLHGDQQKATQDIFDVPQTPQQSRIGGT